MPKTAYPIPAFRPAAPQAPPARHGITAAIEGAVAKRESKVEGGVFEHAGIVVAFARSCGTWAVLFGVPINRLGRDDRPVTLASHVCGRFISDRYVTDRAWIDNGVSPLAWASYATHAALYTEAKAEAEKVRARIDGQPETIRTRRIIV